MKTIKINKITILMFSIILVFPLALWSQQGKRGPDAENKEKIEAKRIAYITKELDLTPQEAEKFWPVYNQHEKQVDKMSKAFHKKVDDTNKELSEFSDEEASKLLEARLNHEEEMFKARKEYLLSLKEVLPTQKILILLKSEKGFRMELMRTASKRGQGMRDGSGQGMGPGQNRR